MAAVMLTAGCTAAPVRDLSELPAPNGPAAPAGAIPPGSIVHQRFEVAEHRGATASSPRIDEVYPAVGENIDRTAATGASVEEPAGDIALDFDNADLRDVVRVILGELLQRNYVVDPDVTGTITLSTERPLHRSALFSVLEVLLAAQGARVIDYGDIYRVTRAGDANALAGGGIAVAPSAPRDGAGYRIYPLRYILATEMAAVLTPLLPQGAIVHTDTSRNLLIIAGTGPELRLAANTVNIFDVDQMRGRAIMVTSLENADVRTITAELESIFAADGKTAAPEGLIQFIPIDRLNAIMVIAKQRSTLEDVRNWVFRLDRRRDPAERRLFVYYVQHSRATELSETLRDIFGDGSRDDLAADRTSGPAAPEAPNAPSAVASSLIPAGGPEAGVRFTTDERNNALLISATTDQFEMIDEVLAKLDIQPLQVLIEASIFEVLLRDELRYGIQYAISNGGLGLFDDGDIALSRGTAVSGTDAAIGIGKTLIGALLPGFNFTLRGSSRTRFVIDTLSALTEVNMISSPNILVLDNQVARLQVGDEVPIVTQTTTSAVTDTPLIVNSVEYRDTGVTLEVTPRVNASGLVTLEIVQEVSDVTVTTSSTIDSPTIQNRRIFSTVVVQDNETVMLGGLIREEARDGKSGFPILHDLPVVGHLFGQTETDALRTELVVLIRPRVIANPREARDMTRDMRQKFLTLLQLERTGVRQPRRIVDDEDL